MRYSTKPGHPLAIVSLMGFLSIVACAGLVHVNANPGKKDLTIRESAREGDRVLRGGPAVDYLKQQGLFERITASITARQYAEQKKVTAFDGAPSEYFGFAVGVGVDRIIVGAYFDDAARGAAYIFERNRAGADNWGLVKKLTAADAAPSDRLGYSVGISGDTVIAGAIGDDAAKGAVYVFERNTGGADNWGQVRKLTASDGTAGDSFGGFLGISRGTVVVGAPFGDSSNGSTYVYERNRGGADSWGEVKKLTVATGTPSHRFGRVDIDGETIVVATPADNSDRGAAYIYERNKNGSDNWGEVKKLTALDGVPGDRLGSAVTISGEMVVVGALFDDSQRGSAYVFERSRGGADNWGEVRKLVASDGVAGDSFGVSVRIDVDTVLVGAAGDDSNKGAAYLYDRNKGGADNWGERKKLMASDGVAGDRFGNSIGICRETIVVGADGDEASRGSAYTFTNRSNQWIEQHKATASDGLAGDRFGDLRISGDTMVVGAFLDDSRKGSAYIFERNQGGADNWGEVKKLTASDGEVNDFFGTSIAINGGTVVIGTVSQPFGRGFAYVFERNKGGPNNWGQVKKLASETSNDAFGSSVAISGTTVVVGAPFSSNGSIYVFERNSGGADNWGQVRRLTASDGTVNDRLGRSVGIWGGTIVGGADGTGVTIGSAYIFERNKGGADTWGEVRKLTASDGALTDQFGFRVAIMSDTVVVGAPSDDSFKGSAYVFQRNRGGADNWGEVKKLAVAAGQASNYFGQAVGVSGDTIVVGSYGDDSLRGSTYVLHKNTGGPDNWGEVKRLTASDGVVNDAFGGSVGISGDTIVVGAPFDDSNRGSAYIFRAFPEAVSVSAASFQRTTLAPEMIVAAFGVDLATGTQVAGPPPLPTEMQGTTVTVRDSGGFERLAQLFFVSPGQVNYHIPSGTSIGPAVVKIVSGSGQVSFGMVEITAVSPGVFSANASGRGIAAALVLRVRGMQQIYEQISRFDAGTTSFVPIPVDLGPEGDQVFLVMYLTGIRFRSSETGVSVRVGGRTHQCLFAGAVSGFVGLDQLNISPLSRDLIGAGVVNIEIIADGKQANMTTVSIK